MTLSLDLGPGKKLVANVIFLEQGLLFVSIVGPAAVTFASIWPPGTKQITNSSADTWRLSIQASHGGPIGSEVPVWTVYQSASVEIIGVGGAMASPEALLTCIVLAHG